MEIIRAQYPKSKGGGNPDFCLQHWPKHMNQDPHAIFILIMVDKALHQSSRFINTAIDCKSTRKAYKRYAPVCCFLGPDIMNHIYEKAAEVHHTITPFD